METRSKSVFYVLGLIALILVALTFVSDSQSDTQPCQLFSASSTSQSLNLDNDFLLLLPNGSSTVSIWSFAEARPVGILPFSATISSWRQPYGNPFTHGSPIRSDTFRVPQIASDGQYIAYATAYSQQDLSRSLQFIWSTTENRIASSFSWQPQWIHFIGWVDEDRLGFLAQDEALSIEIVDLQGVTTETVLLDWLDLSIPIAPWAVPRESTYFVLWSTFAPQSGNLLIWYRADVEEESRVIALNIYRQGLFFERRANEFVALQGGAAYQNPETGTPAWSYSGEWLAIPLYDINFNRNLYLLSNAGTLQQVTFFSKNDSSWQFSVDYPTWSSDDRWIAFWIYESGRQAELYLLDIESDQLINTSIAYSPSPPLFWSPDSRYLGFWKFSDNILTLLRFDDCTIHEVSLLESDLFFDRIIGWGQYP